jgi:ATP-dependent Lon protease
MDFRGDPSSALLEVLDPEQNHTFVDHYVEVEYDLSDVMFVATANTLNIPAPLLDRMEVIRLSGYTEDEKINIAIKYLLPKQLKSNGLKPEEIHVAESALRDIVRYYTREAGVRSLEREIAKVCRKVVKTLLTRKKETKISVTARNLDKFLGVQRYTYGIAEKHNQVGQVSGLAWTEVVANCSPSKRRSCLVPARLSPRVSWVRSCRESIRAALSVVRSRAKGLGIPRTSTRRAICTFICLKVPRPRTGPALASLSVLRLYRY